jgi:hypothetical protein
MTATSTPVPAAQAPSYWDLHFRPVRIGIIGAGEEGRASLEIILAGYESSVERRFIDLKWQTW